MPVRSVTQKKPPHHNFFFSSNLSTHACERSTPRNQTQGLMFKCCIILGNQIVFLLYFINNRWSTNQRIWIARLSTHYSISIGNLPFPSIRFRPFQVVPIMISLDRRRNHRNVNPNLPKIEVLQSITLIDHLELKINRSPNKNIINNIIYNIN